MQHKFNELINFEQQPDSKSVVFLKRMVDDYPYCQPARMLLTKALKHGNKSFYEYQLNMASAIAPDRQVFKAFLDDRHPMLQLDYDNSPVKATEAATVKKTVSKSEHIDSIVDRKRRQKALIDKFIEQNPRIEMRAKDIPDGEISRESIEFKPDVASETLAEILLKQGRKQEASIIYEKLSLMFPEKSSYFAKKLKSI